MLTLRVDILKGKNVQATSWFGGYRYICTPDYAKPEMCSTTFRNRCQHDTHEVM